MQVSNENLSLGVREEVNSEIVSRDFLAGGIGKSKIESRGGGRVCYHTRMIKGWKVVRREEEF